MSDNHLQELDAVARDWIKPPPDVMFSLRVPVEYASLHAAVSIHPIPSLVPLLKSALATSSRAIHICETQACRATLVIEMGHLQLTSEDSYQIAIMGVQGLRVEIVSDGPPPPEDEPP